MNGKTILITGGTSGIGLELTKQLCATGAHVIACGRNEAALEQAKNTVAGATFLLADIKTENGRAVLKTYIQNNAQKLDILINNAGIQNQITIGETDNSAQISDEIDINLTSQIILTDMLLPYLKNSNEAAIVNMLSCLALAPKKSAPVYCATKAALMVFSQALRYQLKSTKIRVIGVFPPLVDTNMTAGTTENGKISAEECANRIIQGIIKGEEHIYIGKARLLRLLHRLVPKIACKIMENN